jgi:hypothetical protein
VATLSAPLAVPPLVRAAPNPVKAEASRTPVPSARWNPGSGDRSPSPLREIKLEENEVQLLKLRPAPGNSRMHSRGLGRRPPTPFPAYLPRIPLPRNKRVSPCSPSEYSLGTSGSPDPLDVIGADHELLVSEQLSEGYGGLSRSGAAESVPRTPVQRDPIRYRSEVCQERKHVFSCRYCRQSSNTSQAAAAAYCFGQRNYQLCTFWQEDGGPEVPPNKRCGQCIAAGGKWAEEAQTCPGRERRERCFFVRKLDCFECRDEGRYANVTDAPVCPHGGRSTSTVDGPQRAIAWRFPPPLRNVIIRSRHRSSSSVGLLWLVLSI